jgi:hypothetical protein
MVVSKLARVACLSIGLAAAIAGCEGRTSLIPNSDPSLRKTPAEFAADAVKRFPYPDLPAGGEANGRAAMDVMRDVIQLANLSDEDWTNFDVWVNQSYVVHVPKIEAHGIRTLDFQMMFNDKGESFPTDNTKHPIKTVQITHDGKMQNVKIVVN